MLMLMLMLERLGAVTIHLPRQESDMIYHPLVSFHP